MIHPLGLKRRRQWKRQREAKLSGWGFIEVIESRHVVRFRETANALDGLSEGTRFACSRFSGLDLIKKKRQNEEEKGNGPWYFANANNVFLKYHEYLLFSKARTRLNSILTVLIRDTSIFCYGNLLIREPLRPIEVNAFIIRYYNN